MHPHNATDTRVTRASLRPSPAADQPRVNVTRHRTPPLTPDEQALVRAWWPHDEALAEALSEETAHAWRWTKGAKRVGKVVGALG